MILQFWIIDNVIQILNEKSEEVMRFFELKNLAQRGQYIHSIKEYKSHWGVCAHKAAVANNLLTVLGYDCEMVWSNTGSENHVFIIIHDNYKHYIYDSTNEADYKTNLVMNVKLQH